MIPFVIRRPGDDREVVIAIARDAYAAVASAAEDFYSGRPIPDLDEIEEVKLEVRKDGAKRWRLFTVEVRTVVQYTAYDDENAPEYDEDDWDNDYSEEEE